MKKLIIGILILFTSVLFAQIPKVLSYQGYLTDAGGTPRNGNAIITFKLYDAPSGGNMLWSEVDKTVIVEKGFFATLLGSPTSFGSLAFDKQYYLTLTPQGENEITPRIPLTSSAYAVNAASVADNAITTSKLAAEVMNALVPIGTIIISALSEAQLNTLMGGNTGRWKICDGQTCSGTTYATLTGRSTVPDLRGMFIRGASSQQKTASTGELITYNGSSVLTFQEDKVQGHAHTNDAHYHLTNHYQGSDVAHAEFWGGAGQSTANPHGIGRYGNSQQMTSTEITIKAPSAYNNGTPRVSTETKPASVSFNYFIKVN
ncbi:MAG: tail fiber protein [Ignavibacteriaceae bacterium]|nr:tail fiber protein [Ignavibacteriaceae bacterium]